MAFILCNSNAQVIFYIIIIIIIKINFQAFWDYVMFELLIFCTFLKPKQEFYI